MIVDKETKMSALKEYTLEIYKVDRRIKGGYKQVEVIDFAPSTKDFIDSAATDYMNNGYLVKIFETYVTRTNLMGGKEFKERYDTPSFCSPSSESYWSM